MGRFFNLHDAGEKKYIFNSFLIFVRGGGNNYFSGHSNLAN